VRGATVTGERVTTPAGGFKPTWERHVAAYKLCADLLPPGRVLDLGCGVGHSYRLLEPRETVGVDIDEAALAGQQRETVVADMRSLPFEDGSFASVLCVQAIEHVPDPDPLLREAARVLEPGGVAVFVTPNRLTFGVPGEIVDPYHHREYEPAELREAVAVHFDEVELHGIFGSPRYLALVEAEREKLAALLRRDPLRVRRLVPRRARQRLYDWKLTRERSRPLPGAESIEPGDFELRDGGLGEALDLVAVGRAGGTGPA
jgi:SAM-dependent methyltransferase